jgi:protein-tyrosine-phosphatase
MEQRRRSVLILCTGNSCRSQIAEGLVNHDFEGSWKASSAGSHPSRFVHPLAIQVMQEAGVSISHQISKSVDVFQGQTFDLVVTVCDNAKDACPRFTGACCIHLPFADPANGDVNAFRIARDAIRKQLGDLLVRESRRLDSNPVCSSNLIVSKQTYNESINRKKIVIFGGGPAGIEAAIYACAMGYEPVVYECNDVGGNILEWGFVRMFTSWRRNVSDLGMEMLSRNEKKLPDLDTCPTGLEFVESYLRPLAEGLQIEHNSYPVIQCGVKVIAISRFGLLKKDLPGVKRGNEPFRILLEKNGREIEDCTYNIIDASGVYSSPCWLGDGGIPALGESELRKSGHIQYHIPDILGKDCVNYSGQRVLLVGAGFSAATALQSLLQLVEVEPLTKIVWARRTTSLEPFPIFKDDPLVDRSNLAMQGNRIALGSAQGCDILSGVVVRSITLNSGSLRVELHNVVENCKLVVCVDRIVALVGFKPDLEMIRELHVHQCYASEGPMKLALETSEVTGDCLLQKSHGINSLRNPEPGFYIIGSKSYGRRSNYLLSLGIEQVKSVFQLIHNDSLIGHGEASGV